MLKKDECIELLTNLESYYGKRGILEKQIIISLIFKEKLIFENLCSRTPILNEALSKIYSHRKVFRKNRKGKDYENHHLSLGVDPERFELSGYT